MDISDFKEVVKKYIDYEEFGPLRIQIKYSKEKAIILADEFQCSERTVFAWAIGVANPHPRIKKLIIDYIKKQEVGS